MRSFLLLFAAILCGNSQAVELKAPTSASVDSDVTVQIIGEVDPKAFVSIVAPETPEGGYEHYTYARSASIKVQSPFTPGTYEVRLLAADRPYSTLAMTTIELVVPEVSIQAADSVPVGTEFSVQWQGPSASREYITLVPIETPDGKYEDYSYTRGEGQGTLKLTTPSSPGSYELRYMTGSKGVVMGRRALSVEDVNASLSFEPTIGMGAQFPVQWQGPGHPRDFIVIVPPEAGPRDYSDYEYATGSPVTLTAPETPGVFEVRLITADSSRVLARAPLTVGGASASLSAADEVEANIEFDVQWTGPGNELDYIAVTRPGEPKSYLSYSYTKRGSPLQVRAPKESGDYELHYLTGRTEQSLAVRKLRVVPGDTPGTLRVSAKAGSGSGASGTSGTSGTTTSIELILDASGSMLQKIGAQRRIDLARTALDQLIQRDIAPGTPVALRVFGHKTPNACDTDLVQPLAGLDRAALGRTVRAIEAKNLAKTPIGASLAAVADDLASVEGQAVVILVTDGEETCDGDPAAEIRKLRQMGFEIVLNIVGFAIDEYALEQEFAHWAELGGGAYFSANDGAALARSVQQAVRTPFGIYQNGKRVASGVLGGDPLSLKPGQYELRAGASKLPLRITAGEQTVVEL